MFAAQWLEWQSSTADIRVPFPGVQYIHQLINYNIVKFLLKTNDGRGRRPNYAVFVVRSASYTSGKTLECEGIISSSNYLGQLLFTRL